MLAPHEHASSIESFSVVEVELADVPPGGTFAVGADDSLAESGTRIRC